MGFFDFFVSMLLGTQKAPVTKNPPHCPECAKPLGRRPQGLYACPHCAGCWLPRDSFQQLLEGEASVEIEPAPRVSQPQHTYQRSPSSRKCAACEARMENYQFAYQSGIWIDACPDQHGIWLDSGELPLILEYQEKTRNRGPLSKEEMHRAATAMLDGALQAKSAYAEVYRQEREEAERRRQYEL